MTTGVHEEREQEEEDEDDGALPDI